MFDTLISGGELIDGSGAPRWRADVGISDGRITAIGILAGRPTPQRINAEAHIVAPGFIDSHTHDDQLLLEHPTQHPKLAQGVTTVVTGNCGISLAPLLADAGQVPAPLDVLSSSYRYADFLSYVNAVQAGQPALNAVLLVGHTTLRVATMADLARAATTLETQRMQRLLVEALAAGASGLSTGVYYPPARAATTEELIAVGQPLKDGAGIVTMHLRNEGDEIDAALQEALLVGRALNTPLVVSHHKLMGQANHGRSIATLKRVQEAARWQPVCMDCYPYNASSTVLLPERVASARDVQITWSKTEPAAAGRSLHEMAAERGLTPTELAKALMPGGAIYFAMHDDNVDRILAHPLTMIGSDGLAPTRADDKPHPRLWGSFARVLGPCVRTRKLFSLETAVHKMTGLTASRFGLRDRGLLRPGFAADMTVFNPETVQDQATYADPTLAPVGIGWVLVNGKLVMQHGHNMGVRAGQLLRYTPG
jgi:N-acyl-D-amino-acid deacylase